MLELSHPRVGVGVLLTDNHGRVLLTLRKRPPEAGCWSIVGGKVDFLETLEQCDIREAREEVSVEISLSSLLCVTITVSPAKISTGFLQPTSGKSFPVKPPTASPSKRMRFAGSASTNCPQI